MPKSPRGGAPTSPHDALFKWTFSQREHAVGLLKAALPKAVVAAVRWSSLRVEKGSFVDPALRARHSDLVLSARIGKGRSERRIHFYCLLEHQRDVEPLMVFRMGVYVMRLWEQLVRDRPGLQKLPPIMPVLLHHSDTGWTAATSFHDLIEGEEPEMTALLPYLPSFAVRLIDLSGGRAGDLVEQALTALGKVVLWCMSVAGDDERLEREVGRIGEALDEVLRAPDGLAALEALLRYLVTTHERLSVQEVGEIFEKATGPQAREVVVTVLDEIELRGEQRGREEGRAEGRAEGHAKGRAEGHAKGRAEGRARTLLDLLALRFGAVPAKVSARVLAAEEAMLATWTMRVLSAPTLKDVIGEDRTRPAPARPSPVRKRSSRA